MCTRNEISGLAKVNGKHSGATSLWRALVFFTAFAARSFVDLAIRRCRPH